MGALGVPGDVLQVLLVAFPVPRLPVAVDVVLGHGVGADDDGEPDVVLDVLLVVPYVRARRIPRQVARGEVYHLGSVLLHVRGGVLEALPRAAAAGHPAHHLDGLVLGDLLEGAVPLDDGSEALVAGARPVPVADHYTYFYHDGSKWLVKPT